ncbi:MAG TPA: NUDIX domain-containing protein, partial [Candidatus Limnocylindrales bacterium]|nr:NUDIX domain-containing protein [Candidatus Limnocylindrales bacterium]
VERVLVVPRDVVPERASWYGLRTEGIDDFLTVVRAHGRHEPRAAMEVDPSFKQIIPYLVLRDGERYFLMRRTKAGGDARLHDRWSIGVGGHVDPGDDGLAGGLRREWHEELVADFEPTFMPYALLNDDTTEVGAVHLGIVVLADAGGREVTVRETDKLSGAFAQASEVAAGIDHLETWSRIVFDALEVAGTRGGR